MGKDGKPADPKEVFTRVRARLRAAVGEDVFNSWFARLELEEIVDDLVHLSVPTRFLCSWIQSNYAEKILDAFKAEIAGVSISRLPWACTAKAIIQLSRPAVSQRIHPGTP